MKNIDLKDTSVSAIIKDYLSQKDSLKFAYHRFPSFENYVAQAEEKAQNYTHRKVLFAELQKQHEELNLSPKQKENLALLAQENTLTVTTGHQLNIATGPLYFLYKIMHVVKLSDELNQKQQKWNFVPIYWMATEDHDWDEIDHFNLYNQKYTCHKEQVGGAVGRLDTSGMEAVISALKEKLPPNRFSEEVIAMLEKAYASGRTLAEATRGLVQELLGEYGILILDADSHELKKLMIPYFEQELLENPSQSLVQATNEKLSEYKNQAYAREINLFYLSENKRERIEREGEEFVLVDSQQKFSQDEFLQILHKTPEKFSPNVILRPMYQEVILPNVAYIGGGGEIAYWLQLKEVFAHYGVIFPMLVVRNSALVLPENLARKAENLGLNEHNMFEPMHEFTRHLVEENSDLIEELEALKNVLKSNFEKAHALAQKTDVSFAQMLKAQEAKQIKGYEKMRKRLLKAERIKMNDKVQRIEQLFNFMFPNGTWQERRINFIQFYVEQGQEFIQEIYKGLLPLENKFIILNIKGIQQK
ncbi:bacillithiol biosynthesis cysteine-adding enzyme BshC [Ornithobacterium rhinotracheale]